ncbi:hypothetical protein ABZ371_04375 [Streptomyces sp. NPDC005899]|uniref:hypothetical protein n=1 Tax=Streptomyces sp. NPDC005899 TaxID=3155716 RepID=UPI0033EDDE05
MEPAETLDRTVAALKDPLERADRAQGWTDELRREIQEEVSITRSVLRRHGHRMVAYLRPRLDEWMAREGIQPGRLRDAVMEVQTLITETHGAAGPRRRP